MRAIAVRAGVDVALIYHYFRDKEHLVAVVLAPPGALAATVARIASDDRPRAVAALDAILGMWDRDPEVRQHVVALVRSGLADPTSASALEAQPIQLAMAVFGDAMAPDHRDLRASLIAIQLTGLLLRRYVLTDPTLADLSTDTVVAITAPIIERILTEPIPEGAS
jgi:AcrR family transcriptional regulator